MVSGKTRNPVGGLSTGLKRERLNRSTGESDAVNLEILREMHALHAVEVEKRCVFPSLNGLSKKQKKVLVDKDPEKELKGKFRRGKASILCVPEVGGVLRDLNPELCGKFDKAFGGTGQNVTKFLVRVAKKKELPPFVWKDPVLSTCDDGECKYCE